MPDRKEEQWWNSSQNKLFKIRIFNVSLEDTIIIWTSFLGNAAPSIPFFAWYAAWERLLTLDNLRTTSGGEGEFY